MNKEQPLLNNEYQCTRCSHIKNEKEFYHNLIWNHKKTEKHWYRNPMCIECVKKSNLDRVKSDPEKRKEQIRKDNARPEKILAHRANGKRQRETGYIANYIKNNPDKQAKYAENHRDHDISEKEWFACLNYFGYECAYCSKTIKEQKQENREQFHKDHVDHDGYNDIRNCAPACTNCGCQKWKHPMRGWFEQQVFFTENKYNKIVRWCEEEYKKYIEYKPHYKIKKRRIIDSAKFEFVLWSVDEKRNLESVIATKGKKKDLIKLIDFFFSREDNY